MPVFLKITLCLSIAVLLSSRLYAVPVTFTIDSSQSQIVFTDVVVGGTEVPVDGGSLGFFGSIDLQGPGSNAPNYAGTIEADVDLLGGTIEFTGSSAIDALPSGTWFPATVDENGFNEQPGPADYAIIQHVPPLGSVYTVFTNVLFDALSDGPQTLSGGTIRTFDSALTMTLLDGVTQGSQGIEIGFGPPVDATGLFGTNDASAGSLEDLGNGLFELTLPIRLEISPEGALGPANILLQGQLVATAIVPEPATVTLLGGALLPVLCYLGRRKRIAR